MEEPTLAYQNNSMIRMSTNTWTQGQWNETGLQKFNRRINILFYTWTLELWPGFFEIKVIFWTFAWIEAAHISFWYKRYKLLIIRHVFFANTVGVHPRGDRLLS